MSRFRLLFQRLLERRLLGDGEAVVSVIPGTLGPLSLSLLVFSLLVPERSLASVSVYLCLAALIWSATRAFLESHDLGGSSLDRAVLDPLPIPASMLAAARALVVGVVLGVSTLNIALPAVILAGVRFGWAAGLLLLLAAYLSALFGMALAGLFRALLEKSFGLSRVLEWEGPIRLGVGVGLFAILFVAPDPAAALADRPSLHAIPPIAFAALPVSPMSPATLLCSGLGAFMAMGGLLLAFVLSGRNDGSQRGGKRRSASLLQRSFRRCCVRPEERASYDFALANMSRDRTFRARVYPLFAFPFAVILLVARNPDQASASLMALYGAAVYLTLAQVFQSFTESKQATILLETLPIRDPAAFRSGSSKAFLVALVLPIYAVLTLALVLLALFGAGLGLVPSLGHALLALLFAVLLCVALFERIEPLAFSAADDGVYPGDLGGAPMVALVLGTLMALLAVTVVEKPIFYPVVVVVLLLLIRQRFAAQRRAARPA